MGLGLAVFGLEGDKSPIIRDLTPSPLAIPSCLDAELDRTGGVVVMPRGVLVILAYQAHDLYPVLDRLTQAPQIAIDIST